MYLTVHLVSALKNRATGITYLICNIPIKNKAKVLELYGDNEVYHIQEHTTPYINDWVINKN